MANYPVNKLFSPKVNQSATRLTTRHSVPTNAY